MDHVILEPELFESDGNLVAVGRERSVKDDSWFLDYGEG